MVKRLPFYDFGPILSRNAAFNFVIGARGLGKTYGAKKLVMRKYLRDGEQFIYLRRYETELKNRQTFFADIQHEFPKYAFRVNGFEAQVCRNPSVPKKEQTWETMGYFIPLSTAQKQKSVSYHRVTTIIFDEFIIERGVIHYLSNEARVMLDFYSTVDRWKDTTRVIFLANSLSIMNPYFAAYDIRPSGDDELIIKNDGFIAAHFPNSSEFRNAVYETRFGKFIKDTEYGDFSVGSQFADNTDTLVQTKSPSARYLYTLVTSLATFSVWATWDTGEYWLQEKMPKDQVCFTTTPRRVSEECQLLPRNHKLLANLRNAYSRGKVYFSSPQVRESFIEVWNNDR